MTEPKNGARPVASPAGTAARHRACRVWDVPRGGVRIVNVGGVELGIFSVGAELVAYRNVCPHAGAPVCAGKITGTTLPGDVYAYQWGRAGEILRCPWHGWEFDLATGDHLADPSVRLRRYALTVVNDEVFVEL